MQASAFIAACSLCLAIGISIGQSITIHQLDKSVTQVALGTQDIARAIREQLVVLPAIRVDRIKE
jgi:hypothetical protein